MTAKQHLDRYLSMWRNPPKIGEPGWNTFAPGLEKVIAAAQREAREEMREIAAKTIPTLIRDLPLD